MTDTFRTFIAVKIPVCEPLQQVLNELRNVGRPVKAVADDDLHLTLKFLGDVRRDRTDEISKLLEGVCLRQSPFRVNIRGIGAFPHVERPSVIWAGISGCEPLIMAVNEIERRCANLGYPKEVRPFRPHVTLARVGMNRGSGNSLPVRLQRIMREFRVMEFDDVDVDRIVFFRSQLSADGPGYSELSTAELSPKI